MKGKQPNSHPELDSGSCCSNKAFTLLELLVVVIIIAVLAAVAVPQYKHAVLKSRFSTVMPMAKSLADAQEVYYLGRGYYAQKGEEDLLDVNPVAAEKTQAMLSEMEGYNYVLAQRTDIPGARYMMFQKYSPNYAGNIYCEADDEEGDWLCESIGGVLQEYSITGSRLYLISGDSMGLPPVPSTTEETQNANACQAGDSVPDSVQAQMNSVLATAKQNSGNNGLSVSANCVNGEWKYTWSGGGYLSGDFNESPDAYQFAGYVFEYGGCSGYFEDACAGITFTEAACFGNVENGCANAVFENSSYCDAYAPGACRGSVFKDGTWCYGDCDGAIIEAGGYCHSKDGDGGCAGAVYKGGCCVDHTPGACGPGNPRCSYDEETNREVWDGVTCSDGNGGSVTCSN